MKKMTLLELLKSLPSYSPAFKDTRTDAQGRKVRRVKCDTQLSKKDFDKVCAAVKDNPDVIEVNNDYEWTMSTYRGKASLTVFVIKTIKPLSEIKINL